MKETFISSIDLHISAEDPALIPTYASEGASGADLRAYITQELRLLPGCSVLVPTGIRVAIPEGFEIQIRPRSGLALKQQITVLNTPGTIDSDYRGEIGVILINHGKAEFVITPGMRIAQMVVAPFIRANFLLSSELASTTRGSGGFGHTGAH